MKRIKRLKELLEKQVLIGDGAMGTMIYERGVFLNRCFEELNISSSDLIRQIHDEYIDAGADFIETNTFAANEIKLARYGLAPQMTEIINAGVSIARQSAGQDKLVAGSVGPLGIEIEGPQGRGSEKPFNAFYNQISALNDAGVDFVLLETFTNPDELEIAIQAAAKFEDLPVVAQVCIDVNLCTRRGHHITAVLKKICSYENVIAAGLNCGVGPSSMLEAIESVSEIVTKPISVMPNAGMPREVDGRSIYMSTPEYMSEYAKRFYEKGARIIGGCCGTRPEHIKQIAYSVHSVDKAMSGVSARVERVSTVSENVGFEPTPFADKSIISKKIAEGQKVYTIEIMPPRGTAVEAIIEKAKLCAQHGIDAINIPDGPRASSRLSAMVTAMKITEAADIEVILHVCCRDKNLISMQSDMLGVEVLGLKNVLLITGDPPKLGDYPDATAVFDLDSIALTSVVNDLNRGIDIAGNQMDSPLSLTVSVGANPVAADMERELDRFRQKVEAGAEYCITQPVFDPENLYRFMDAVKDHSLPVVAGIWPFASFKNAEFMANEVPGVVVPDKLLERMSKAKTKEEGRRIGVEIAREMVEEISDVVAGFAISAPFGNVNTALAVLDRVDVQ